jgi:phosphomannomutase
MQVEKATGTSFAFGYEEALGYTVGTVVRDKDGVGAAAVFAELAAHHRSQGRSILDELERIYRRFGLYVSSQKSITQKGLDGAARIADMMTALRSNPPSRIGSFNVVATRDYKLKVRKTANGTTEALELPASNVLAFELEGGSRVVARPSGTEPKIKFYFDIREPVAAGEAFEHAERRAADKLAELEKAFLAIAS